MKLTKQIIVILFLGISGALFSQDDAYKALIKRSAVYIHKAQKFLIAANKTDAGGKLAKAVLLQTYAVKLYAEKNENLAGCSSLEARNLAFEIVKEIRNPKATVVVATDDEKKITGACATQESLLAQSKKTRKDLSLNDKDYMDPKSLNSTNIDLK